MSFSLEQADHINVKIFARENGVDLEPAIPMFHRWIQDSVLDELLIDVADYRHVPEGPGVMLIGHSSNYSLDLAFGRLGLLYNSKLPGEGSLQDKLQRALEAALRACTLIEKDPLFARKLSFNAGQLEIFFNDRLRVPNTEEVWAALKPELERFLQLLFLDSPVSLQRVGEPRERLRVAVTASGPVAADVLTERLSAVSTG